MNIVVLGEGPHAGAMAQILCCPWIPSAPKDSGWKWPTRALGEHVSFGIMPGAKVTTARIIRWHSEAWRCPRARQVRCAIIGLREQLTNDLVRCDVFGRIGDYPGDTFADWSKHTTLFGRSAGLLEILNGLASLSYCPVTAWVEAVRRASVIPPLLKAIRSRTYADLHGIMPAANQVNWDAICPHHSAHLIRDWLRRVTPGVTQELWDEGERLFAPLTKRVERQHATTH